MTKLETVVTTLENGSTEIREVAQTKASTLVTLDSISYLFADLPKIDPLLIAMKQLPEGNIIDLNENQLYEGHIFGMFVSHPTGKHATIGLNVELDGEAYAVLFWAGNRDNLQQFQATQQMYCFTDEASITSPIACNLFVRNGFLKIELPL